MRYETAVAIGRGASAEVFKAWDPIAERTVAIKIFTNHLPDSVARRERETEAQQSLRHPAICEIHEVGVMDGGQDFIAMRFVDGEPLDRVAARVSIRRRVELVREIADAVAVAHSRGIVHRDLKPSNLLVEEQADGSLRPFVLDFGIARVADVTRLTATGQMLGTPGYLSPEQARGDREIDARSDVFSLGIVLYQVLTGDLPFDADSSVGAVLKVLEHEPRLAHIARPDVPTELSHIAHKAMEKDPRRRYSDAAALRRDLDRFLRDGASSARGVGPLGRLGRRIERRPVPWLIGAALGLGVVASLGWALRNQVVAERQLRDAEVFARQSAEIEAQLRYLELLPQHSIEQGRWRLAGEVDDLARAVDKTRGQARAAGEYAVGRGELALGRVEPAIARFNAARADGFENEDSSLALSLALLEKFRRELVRVELMRDANIRDAERERLREQLSAESAPLTRDATTAPPLATTNGRHLLALALSALLADDHDAARRLAADTIERAPWMIEADLIHADTFRAAAAEARVDEAFMESLAALDQEVAVLDTAIVRAPSAPILHVRLCQNRLMAAQLALALATEAPSWRDQFAAAAEACRVARVVLPSHRDAGLLSVEIGWRRGLEILRRDGAAAARDDLEAVLQNARAARDASPDGAAEHWNLGNALFAWAAVQRDLGEPTVALYDQATEALQVAASREPGRSSAWQSLGHAWVRHGGALDVEGHDPRPSYRRAIAAYQQGMLGTTVQQSRLLSGICVAQSELAYYGVQHRDEVDAEEVETALANGAEACNGALARDPSYNSARSNLALLYWTLAEWRIATDESPLGAASQGMATYQALLAADPNHVSGRNNLAGMVAAVARWRLDQASDPASYTELVDDVRSAREALLPVVDRIPVDAFLHLARLAVFEAAALCETERLSPTPRAQEATDNAWRDAQAAVTRIPRVVGGDKHALHRALELHRRAARCALLRGRTESANQHIAQGLEVAGEVLAIDPAMTEVHSEREALIALRDRQSPQD